MSDTTATVSAPAHPVFRMIVREPAGRVVLMGLPLGADQSVATAFALGLRDMGSVRAVRLLVSTDGFRSARVVFDV